MISGFVYLLTCGMAIAEGVALLILILIDECDGFLPSGFKVQSGPAELGLPFAPAACQS